jgi:hypothetical protein
MPDVIQCPYCHQEVSAKAIDCQRCGTLINEVPLSVTVEVLESLRDEDLLGFLFWYAAKLLEEHGCFQNDGPSDAEVLAKLPRGLRIGYTLIVLISEVNNGGFYQWFTNSSGKITYESLDDLRLIVATEHVRVVEQAIQLNKSLEAKYPLYKNRWEESPQACGHSESDDEFWSDLETNFTPEFDRLSNEMFSLEDTEPIWTHFAKFVRGHEVELVHQ